MKEITHLSSQRAKHLTTHYELRGHPEIGFTWWLIYDKVDISPKMIGAEEFLPKHAYDELQRLRQPARLKQRRKARHINATLTFFPGESHNRIPHAESVEWLRQFKRTGEYQEKKGYLVLAYPQEDPVEIWESTAHSARVDLLDSVYTLVWKAEE